MGENRLFKASSVLLQVEMEMRMVRNVLLIRLTLVPLRDRSGLQLTCFLGCLVFTRGLWLQSGFPAHAAFPESGHHSHCSCVLDSRMPALA